MNYKFIIKSINGSILFKSIVNCKHVSIAQDLGMAHFRKNKSQYIGASVEIV